MSDAQMIKAIKTLPDHGEWWRTGNESTFIHVAKRLRELGMPAEEVVETLSEVYAAVSDEYGC